MGFTQGFQFKNISGATNGFDLRAGQYGIEVQATWGGGSVTFQRLSSDGTTWVTISTYTANTYEYQNVPAGTYRFGVTTATAVYADISPVVLTD